MVSHADSPDFFFAYSLWDRYLTHMAALQSAQQLLSSWPSSLWVYALFLLLFFKIKNKLSPSDLIWRMPEVIKRPKMPPCPRKSNFLLLLRCSSLQCSFVQDVFEGSQLQQHRPRPADGAAAENRGEHREDKGTVRAVKPCFVCFHSQPVSCYFSPIYTFAG